MPHCSAWASWQVGFNSRYWLYCQWLYHLFFLNLRVSRPTIKNLKWQVETDIIWVTFGKFVTSLVQKLKILGVYKNCECRYLLQIVFLTKYLKLLDQWCYKFSKGYQIISPPTCRLRFSIFILETLKVEWQCSQYLELNPTCGHFMFNDPMQLN